MRALLLHLTLSKMVLPVLLLLPLSSASLLHILNKSITDRNGSLLKPDLSKTALVPSNISVSTHRRLLTVPESEQKRWNNPLLPTFDNNGKLKWQKWKDGLPDEAVSVYVHYTDRSDYICKYRCHAGFYNRDKGPYCYYPNGGKEEHSSSFDILVNEDNFEVLEWQTGSHGSVPQHSVRTCSSEDIYVGKNQYGLGMVDRRSKSFYLPWRASEYQYNNYEVLKITQDFESQHIDNVTYNISEADIFHYPPETFRVFTVTNHECSPITKTATLSKSVCEERRWDTIESFMVGVKTSFTAGLLNFVSGSIEVSAEVSHQFSEGQTVREESTHTISVTLTVPTNHRCKIQMVAYKYKSKVPFTARLSRDYGNRDIKSTAISGMFHGTQVGEVGAVVEKCEPILNVTYCCTRMP